MTDEQYVVDVRNDVVGGKFEAWLGSQTVGLVIYGRTGSRYVLTHAAVLPEYQHRGIGFELISHTLEAIRAEGSTATIICPVVREFIDRHPEYEDVVDRAVPGIKTARADRVRN